MPAWTKARERRLIRNPDSTFRAWTGGREDTRDSSFRGNYIHITAEFKRQEGRAPREGDVHIHRNIDGSPHKQAAYYVRTENGWRKSTTEHRKPTISQVREQIKRSRRGGRK